ncbi:MAG: hypothetical protein JWR09_2025 [Mucilaginibacter sp.]|nr:hypothetical protein [Mucilaginibacter sp.]
MSKLNILPQTKTQSKYSFKGVLSSNVDTTKTTTTDPTSTLTLTTTHVFQK